MLLSPVENHIWWIWCIWYSIWWTQDKRTNFYTVSFGYNHGSARTRIRMYKMFRRKTWKLSSI